jgi:SAM-dependent methyltransferase
MSSWSPDICRKFVFNNGHHVGDYEGLYQNCDDPWNHCTDNHHLNIDRRICYNLLEQHTNIGSRILEYGCGLGHNVNYLHSLGLNVSGLDISQTAINRARETFPHLDFYAADCLDADILDKLKPDVLYLSHVLWYILDRIELFSDLVTCYSRICSPLYLLNSVQLYDESVEYYGKDLISKTADIVHLLPGQPVFSSTLLSHSSNSLQSIVLLRIS